MFSIPLLLINSFIFRVAVTGAALFFGVTLHAHEKCIEILNLTITRESVIADLRLWQSAGLDKYEPLQVSYGLEPEAYRFAQEKYIALKNANQAKCDTTQIDKNVLKKN